MNPLQNQNTQNIITGSDGSAPHPFWHWRIHSDPKHHKVFVITIVVLLLAIAAVVAYMIYSHMSVMGDIDKTSLPAKQKAAEQKAQQGQPTGTTPTGSNPQQPGSTPGGTSTQPGGTTGSTGGTTSGGSTGGTTGGSSGGTSTGSCSGAANHIPGGKDGTGTCWPGPTNTGVPAGTALTNYTGPCVITTANTVIDSKTINCADGMGILAANVTIKNSKVNTYILVDTDRVGGINFSLTLQDSEVDAQGSLQSAVGGANLTIIRANIHGGINGSECDPPMNFCTIKDSYLHNPTFVNNVDTHLGGFLSDGGVNLTITHNSIFCDTPVNNVGGGCTGDFNMIPNFAAINGALIEHNLFGANEDLSYCTYGGEKPSSPTPHSYNIVYKDNIFQKGTNGICGAYGPVTGFDINNAGNQWTNNKYTDGSVVNPEN